MSCLRWSIIRRWRMLYEHMDAMDTGNRQLGNNAGRIVSDRNDHTIMEVIRMTQPRVTEINATVEPYFLTYSAQLTAAIAAAFMIPSHLLSAGPRITPLYRRVAVMTGGKGGQRWTVNSVRYE